MAPRKTGGFFISAGDISGDMHAAGLIARCRAANESPDWRGLGGARMAAAGCRLLVPPEPDPIIGFKKVAGRIPHYAALLARVHHHMKQSRPDLVVLVDYPGLNIQIARLARMIGLKVLYFICPQYWAWAPWRLQRFARLVDRALVILPFEKEYFRAHGLDAVYVGHPACDRAAAPGAAEPTPGAAEPTPGAAEPAPRAARGRVLALFPGSRRHEVQTNLPVMARVAGRLLQDDPTLVPWLTHQRPECIDLAVKIAAENGLAIRAAPGDLVRTAAAARLCLVASGTATFEAALAGTPFAVLYRVSPAALKLSRRFLTVPWFCQVNLMAGEEIVPEYLLDDDDPGPLAEVCQTLWADTPERRAMMERLAEFKRRHGRQGALDRAAAEVLRFAGLSS